MISLSSYSPELILEKIAFHILERLICLKLKRFYRIHFIVSILLLFLLLRKSKTCI